MKGKKWLVLLASLAVVLLASSVGVTRSSFVDLESSIGNSFQAWASTKWVQTTETDFNAGVPNNVEVSSPGDVKLATSSGIVTDTFDTESKISSKTNLAVSGGQVKLTGGSSTSTTLQPSTADSYVMHNDANKNFGTETLMWVNSKTDNQNWRSFVTFDLSSIPAGSTVSSATLSLRMKDPPSASRTLEVQRVNASWSESSITWNNQPGVSGSAVTTSTGTSAEVWLTWDVTADLQDFIQNQTATNYGWRIKDQAEGSSTEYKESFYTRDETSETTARPKLSVDYTSAYDSPGTLTSTNLLSGQTVGSIDSFDYTASAIPSGTNLKVQLSQDNTNWYDSAGSVGGWDTLSQGTHSIDLGGLGWSGPNFYYKAEFTSDGTDTPVLDEISLNYSSYYATGTIASQVRDTGLGGARWDGLFWDQTVEGGTTDITFEVRASDASFAKDTPPETISWTSVGGTSPVTSGLPSGRYMQWRATLTTSNTLKTPTLHEVRVYHY